MDGFHVIFMDFENAALSTVYSLMLSQVKIQMYLFIYLFVFSGGITLKVNSESLLPL